MKNPKIVKYGRYVLIPAVLAAAGAAVGNAL
jgi:hypothetical protein